MATGMALCAVTAGSQSPIKAIECVCIELLITSRLLGQEVTWPETRSMVHAQDRGGKQLTQWTS
jgi:hypothetical protein